MARAERVVDRVQALRRLVDTTSPYLPAARLAPARALVDRAGERLSLSRSHTVVALAGATGSGKSTLFNALAGKELSPVGFRRPTTGAAHACVWGADDGSALLDWLGVPPARRFSPAGPDADRAALDGLVLLDLPDFDSVESAHRVEVDRLLTLVDLLVWVLDPQKYADSLVHEQYLARFNRHRDVTVVLLNQADLLAPADVDRCLADLGRLLDDDGLGGVPVIATSPIASPGVDTLRERLAGAVSARLAALRRLGADVDGVAADLAGLFDAAPPSDVELAAPELTDALAHAAGVPVVAAATGRAYRHRAIAAMGWPVSRWLRRLRPDPLRRLHLGGAGAPVTSLPAPSAATRAEVGLALRRLAERAAGSLPPPWPDAVLATAREAGGGDLADALDLAVAGTDLGMPVRRPLWWRAVGALQWLATLAALAGLAWLGVRAALFALALPDLLPMPEAGRVPVPTALLVGGLLAGLLVSVLVRPVVRIVAARRRRRAAARLRAAVDAVARERVVAPVNAAVRAYRDGRAAMDEAVA
jgi:hypothetical protein